MRCSLKTLLSRVVLILGVLGFIACGDLDQLDEEELRQLVRRARDVLRTELAKDNDAATLDELEQVLIDVLNGEQGDSTDSSGTNGKDDTYPDYKLNPNDLGLKTPGSMFSVEVVTNDTDVAKPRTQPKSLFAYNGEGAQVPAVLAQWKENVRDNVYDLSAAAGESAVFDNLFIMQAALRTDVRQLGGIIGSEEIGRAALTVEGTAHVGTRVLIVNRYHDGLYFNLGGDVRQALDRADKVMSYLALNAAGDVVDSAIHMPATVFAVTQIDGAYRIAVKGATCVFGSPVLIRMGNSEIVYETPCR